MIVSKQPTLPTYQLHLPTGQGPTFSHFQECSSEVHVRVNRMSLIHGSEDVECREGRVSAKLLDI